MKCGGGLRRGFTLIELLVVIVILGLLATLYVTKVVPAAVKAKHDLTKVQIANFTAALDSFKADTGRYPDALEDLLVRPQNVSSEAYREGGYLKELPTDGWKNKFLYRRLAGGTSSGFELISYGADARPGGDGYDADIVK